MASESNTIESGAGGVTYIETKVLENLQKALDDEEAFHTRTALSYNRKVINLKQEVETAYDECHDLSKKLEATTKLYHDLKTEKLNGDYQYKCLKENHEYFQNTYHKEKIQKLKTQHERIEIKRDEAFELQAEDYKDCSKRHCNEIKLIEEEHKKEIDKLKKQHVKAIMGQMKRHLKEVDIASKLIYELEDKLMEMKVEKIKQENKKD